MRGPGGRCTRQPEEHGECEGGGGGGGSGPSLAQVERREQACCKSKSVTLRTSKRGQMEAATCDADTVYDNGAYENGFLQRVETPDAHVMALPDTHGCHSTLVCVRLEKRGA